MTILNNRFSLGEIVYLKTDQEQSPRIVTAFMYSFGEQLLYRLAQGEFDSLHFEVEITSEKEVRV